MTPFYPRLRFFLVAASAALVLSGCSIFGKTSAFTLRMAPPQAEAMYHIHSVDLDYDQHKIKQVAVASYAIGNFNEKDASSLEKSLDNTIMTFNDDRPTQQLNLQVMVRNYLLSASNSEGSILACIAWAMLDHEGVVYEEQFYVSQYFSMVPLGKAKTQIHRHIVDRIGQVSRLVVQDQADQIAQVEVAHIHFDYDEATATLPTTLTSYFTPVFFGPGYMIFSSSTVAGGTTVSQNREDQKMDWAPYVRSN